MRSIALISNHITTLQLVYLLVKPQYHYSCGVVMGLCSTWCEKNSFFFFCKLNVIGVLPCLCKSRLRNISIETKKKRNKTKKIYVFILKGWKWLNIFSLHVIIPSCNQFIMVTLITQYHWLALKIFFPVNKTKKKKEINMVKNIHN